MKGITYEDLVTHYGMTVCNNETGCIYSASAHSRGTISHWRGDVIHWDMNRRVTKPGIVNFLRAIGRDVARTSITTTTFTTWIERMAEECMWTQKEAQQSWGVELPAGAFARERKWLKNNFEYLERTKTMTLGGYTSQAYLWVYSQEGA